MKSSGMLSRRSRHLFGVRNNTVMLQQATNLWHSSGGDGRLPQFLNSHLPNGTAGRDNIRVSSLPAPGHVLAGGSHSALSHRAGGGPGLTPARLAARTLQTGRFPLRSDTRVLHPDPARHSSARCRFPSHIGE
jgi:hypothetical protein